MFESEVNDRFEPADQLGPDVLMRFVETARGVSARSMLFWGEHCTECAMPECYVSCELYRPRSDLRCRRFAEGMVRLDHPGGTIPYLLKVRFRRWGKLMAWGSGHLYARPVARLLEQLYRGIGWTARHAPAPFELRSRATRRLYAWKKDVALRGGERGPRPTSFLLECFNPAGATTLSAQFRPFEGDAVFHARVTIEPGYNAVRIDADEIRAAVDLSDPHTVQIIPAEASDGRPNDLTLYFGALEFVHEPGASAEARPVKCVVWDLDNTLWRGTLVEDGLDKLELDDEIAAAIRDLDRRGVLHSIASKNDEGPAREALRHFGMLDYFVAPQISWGRKSASVRRVAESLGIGRDSLLFIDDSPFERAEVSEALPEVRVLASEHAFGLAARPEFQVPVTSDSVLRRQRYLDQARREDSQSEFARNPLEFLRHCEIEIGLESLSPESLDRANELAQRTNQLNFSGHRYDRQELEVLMSAAGVDTWLVHARDRFGEYGIVGFAVVETDVPRLTDLMFSCRVMGRRIEHAFLTHLAAQYRKLGAADIFARYRRTDRNEPAGRVFRDLGFEQVGETDGVEDWRLPADVIPEPEGLVRIHELESRT